MLVVYGFHSTIRMKIQHLVRFVCQAECEVIMQIKDDLQFIKSPTTIHIMDMI